MGLFDPFRKKKATPGGGNLSQKALTPQEIERLHAELHPEKQTDSASLSQKQALDQQDLRLLYPLPLDENVFAGSGQPINPQTQSLLFHRLPREVRMQIWSHVMGHMKLYITAKNKKWTQAAKLNEFGWWKKWWLLDIPLTCRIAYLESISYLYASNTFCFGFGSQGTKQPITLMQSVLREQHIASIRRIELGWHFVRGYSNYYDSHPQAWDFSITICEPDNDEDWYKACATLAELPGLRSLKIVVWTSGVQREELADDEEKLLAPLTKIKHLATFDVLLPWKQANADLWKEAPFRVWRNFQDKERYNVCIPLMEDDSLPLGIL